MKKFLKIFFCFVLIGIVCIAMAKSYHNVDNYVKNAPAVASENDLKRVVRYLTSEFNSDEDKARAIYAWIVYNIDYDDYKYKRWIENHQKSRQKEVPTVDVIEKTHAGICGEISELYVKMAQYANLKAEVIHGIAVTAGARINKDNMDEFEHAWVAVKIDREWEYIDPTWAIPEKVFTDVRTDGAYRRELQNRVYKAGKIQHNNRSVSNDWFMTDKEDMIKTHFPNDERWQLQRRHRTLNQFLRQFR
ncbi:MAG: hypothetical protein II942_02345 [Alphaproteobacteria bacterium]|nr:hypothetical protein [Alphaproteobacteria bacterium]